MTILDKIESVAQGLMLFEGEKQVVIKVSIEESKKLLVEIKDEYPNLNVKVGCVVPEFTRNHYHFLLHGVNYVISFPNEA